MNMWPLRETTPYQSITILQTFTLNSMKELTWYSTINFLRVKQICSTNCYNKNYHYTLITDSPHSLNRKRNEQCKTINKSPKTSFIVFSSFFPFSSVFSRLPLGVVQKTRGPEYWPRGDRKPDLGPEKRTWSRNFQIQFR